MVTLRHLRDRRGVHVQRGIEKASSSPNYHRSHMLISYFNVSKRAALDDNWLVLP